MSEAGLGPRPSPTPHQALIGSVLAERYRVEKLLGSGGMGSVYRAQHVHMRKSVAIKVLHREMTYLPEVVARFEREAVAAARIEHPNVAAATDFGRLADGSFYLVLEYVEGKSLRAALKERGPMSTTRALHVTRQIADALAAAHAAGIVHRDLKPDNVMLLDREGERELVKVLDFGIAKLNIGDVKEQLTQLGSVFGTPEYMAPEQAQGLEVDARADLYTLGILLYEMLAGKHAVQRRRPGRRADAHADDGSAAAAAARGAERCGAGDAALAEEPGGSRPDRGRAHAARGRAARPVATPAPVSVGTPSPSRAAVELGDTVLNMRVPPGSVAAAASGPWLPTADVRRDSGTARAPPGRG